MNCSCESSDTCTYTHWSSDVLTTLHHSGLKYCKWTSGNSNRCVKHTLWFQFNHVFTGTLQEYQKRMKKLDQQYKERLRNAGKFTFIEMQKEGGGVGGARDYACQHWERGWLRFWPHCSLLSGRGRTGIKQGWKRSTLGYRISLFWDHQLTLFLS